MKKGDASIQVVVSKSQIKTKKRVFPQQIVFLDVDVVVVVEVVVV